MVNRSCCAIAFDEWAKKFPILNLGCGENIIEGAVNIDFTPKKGVEEMDISLLPWPWEDNSIGGIYMFHCLEHLKNYEEVIKECHRVLRAGGFLYLAVPHSSSVQGIGCFGHYHTFAYNTFEEYLSRPFYKYQKPLFDTKSKRLSYLGEGYRGRLNFINKVMSFLINLCPSFYERLGCYYVGSCYELIWYGTKIGENAHVSEMAIGKTFEEGKEVAY